MRGAGPPAISMPHSPDAERVNKTFAPVCKCPNSTRPSRCPNANSASGHRSVRTQATVARLPEMDECLRIRLSPQIETSELLSVGRLIICQAGPTVGSKGHSRQSGFVIQGCRRIRLPCIPDRFWIRNKAGRDDDRVSKYIGIGPVPFVVISGDRELLGL